MKQNETTNDHHHRAPHSGLIQHMMTLLVTPPSVPATPAAAASQSTNTTTTKDRSIHLNTPTTNTPHQATTATTTSTKEDHYQQLSYRMIVELQRFEWQHQLMQRQIDLDQCIQFLQSIMEDWSARSWVVSEYHIAKRKTGKLKFWYNQLSSPELQGLAFFEFDFHGTMDDKRNHRSSTSDPYTHHMMKFSRLFWTSMHRRLTKRSVLEMMLQTKATHVLDRFHAIIPLAPKYKHHIKDRHSLQQLGITDMLSVRLQLMEWMDTKDGLVLVYGECSQPFSSSLMPFSVPTFATPFKAIRPGLSHLLTRFASCCNFDLDRRRKKNKRGAAVKLVRHRHREKGKDVLWLRPHGYYSLTPCCLDDDDDRMKMMAQFWKEELDMDIHNLFYPDFIKKQQLDAVAIPLFKDLPPTLMDALEASDTAACAAAAGLTITLIGSMRENIWIQVSSSSSLLNKEAASSVLAAGEFLYFTQPRFPDGFRVY